MLLGVRRFLSRGPTGRGDYDALPLSELRPASDAHHDLSLPPALSPSSPPPGFTIRRVGFTVLSTILAITAFIFVFSKLQTDEVDFATKDTAIGPQRTLRLSGEGGFYRDAYPIRSMLRYWETAEREVRERGLDTCQGQLSRELIDAYVRSAVDYCHPVVSQKQLSAIHDKS